MLKQGSLSLLYNVPWLNYSFKTLNSKQKTRKAQKNGKLVFQKNRQKIQTYINPIKQNNDHIRIMCKVRFRSSFKTYFLPQNYSCMYQRVQLYLPGRAMFFDQV